MGSPHFVLGRFMKITEIMFWVLSVCALLLFIRLWAGSGSYPEIWALQERITKQEAENKALIERNEKLIADVQSISEDPKAIEGHARSELGMVKRGEMYYQVILKQDESTKRQDIPQVDKKAYVE